MIKKISKLIIIFAMFFIPFNGNALCEPFFNKIRGFESYGDEIYNEDTVASGEVLEYILQSSTIVYSDEHVYFNRSIKVILPTSGDVVCSIVPLNSELFTYNNGVFTINENKIPKYTNTSIWSEDYNENLAKIQCKMPTVEKYNRGYKFTVAADYETVDRNGEDETVKTIRDDSKNNIDLVNPTYLKSFVKPTAGFTASLDNVKLEEPCNEFFCIGETTLDKVTLKYSLNNSKFKLMYATGKYYNIFDIRDTKEFTIDNLNGSVTINLDYGNNYIGIGAIGDGTSEYEKVAKELEDFNTFECLDDIDIDPSVSEEKAFVINRLDVRSNDSTLKSLSISNATINFNQNLKNYFVDVANDVTEVTITSQLNHTKASYVNGFGNRKVKLNEGKNEVLIKVKAENGSESVYSITITRSLSNNNNLTSISVDDKVIKMIKNKLKYTINVNNEITKVNITGVAEHEKATITVDNKDLVVGSNIISITVTAPNGEKKIYELDIVRDDLISTNADLKNIIISGYKLDFSSNVNKYNLTIKNEDELDIKVVTDSDKAKYLITGNSKLKDGSIIKIKVTAEDKKTENIYEINITKEKKSFPILLILGICAGVGLLVVIIVVLTKKPKDNSLQAVTEVTTDSLNNNLIDEQIANTIVVDQVVETTEINDNNNNNNSNNNNISEDVVTTEEPVLISSEEIKINPDFDDDII